MNNALEGKGNKVAKSQSISLTAGLDGQQKGLVYDMESDVSKACYVTNAQVEMSPLKLWSKAS